MTQKAISKSCRISTWQSWNTYRISV